MYWFEVETLQEKYIVKKESLSEIKKEYNKILNSYSYISLSKINIY